MKLCYYAAFSIILTVVHQIQTLPLRGKSFFSPRSQSLNAARNVVGLETFMYTPTRCTNWGLLATTFNYSHAFSTRRVAEYFFGHDHLHFSGSQVPDRDEYDILADYFGLGTTFNGEIVLRPHWESALADLRLHIGLDGITQGLYVDVYSPISWVRSHIRLDETIFNNGTLEQYPALYMSNQAIAVPISTIKDALNRTTLWGDVQEPLKFGKIGDGESKHGFADLRATLGWNFMLCDHGHFGVSAHMAIPTGNRSTAEFLFEPIVGNGHHFELGIGASGHVRVWEKDGEQELAIYLEATLAHLFASQQCRSFDFYKNGFGSRYLLLKEFNHSGTYIRKLVPAINKTTLRCNVSHDAQVEFLFMFGYHNCDLAIDFGYNGWIRSKERIKLKGELAQNKYGIKGIQNVTLTAGTQSGATESDAKLHGRSLSEQGAATDPGSPVFVSTRDLNVKSAAAPSALSHKLFAHASYTWQTSWKADPFLGIGTEVEFEGIKPRDSEPNKPTLSQISIWIKGGLVY